MSTPLDRHLLQPIVIQDDIDLSHWGICVYVDCSILNKDITITLPYSKASTPTGELIEQSFGLVQIIKTDNSIYKVFVEPFSGDKINNSTGLKEIYRQFDTIQCYNNNTINITSINGNYNLQKLISSAVANNVVSMNLKGEVIDSGKSFSTDISLAGNSDNLIPTQKAIKSYVDSSVVGLFDLRGTYDISSGQYPSTGGSGPSGTVNKGDAWIISVAGTIGTKDFKIGDIVISLVDNPGQTDSNWAALGVSIYDNSITYEMIQKAGANTYLGNSTSSSANVQEISTKTAFNRDFETNTSEIKSNGTTSVGISNNIARADHVHGSDNSKQNIISPAVANNVVSMNVNGQVIDSGKAFSIDNSLSANSQNNIPVESVIKYNVDYLNNRISNLPIGAGAGANYYFTNDVNGSYLTLSTTPKNGIEQTLTATVNNNSSLLGSFATTSSLNRTQLDAGSWEFNFWAKSDSTQATTNIYAEIYKLSSSNVETLLFTVDDNNNIGSTTTIQYSIGNAESSYSISTTDKLLIKLYAKTTRSQDTLVTVYYNSINYYSHAHTPLVGYHNQLAGVQGGNGNTEYYHLSQSEYNNVINPASATTNGYLSSTNWNTFNNKQNLLNNPVTSATASGLNNQVVLANGSGNQVSFSTLLPASTMPEFTGDVIKPSGSTVQSIADNAVVNSKIANSTIENAKLVNSSVGISGTTVTLGSSISRDNVIGVSENGLIKRTGTNNYAKANANDDYLPATSGTSIQKANGSGGLTSATAGSDYQAPLTNPVTLNTSTALNNELLLGSGNGTQAKVATTLPSSAMPALNGDITNTAGSLTTTISNNVVTTSKIQQAPAKTLLGNNSSNTSNVDFLSSSQINNILSTDNRVVYVSEKNGSDLLNDGLSPNTPVKTLLKGLIVGASLDVNYQIVLYPGTYTANTTIIGNCTITGVNSEATDIVYLSGVITVNNSNDYVFMKNLAIAELVHTRGDLYFDNVFVTTSFTKNNTVDSKFEATNSNILSGSSFIANPTGIISNVSITGPGAVNLFGNNKVGEMVINNIDALVEIRNNTYNLSIILQSGKLNIYNSIITSITNTVAAITTSAGTTCTLSNVYIQKPNGTFGTLSLSGSYALDDVNYDALNSVLSINRLNNNSSFINIISNKVINNCYAFTTTNGSLYLDENSPSTILASGSNNHNIYLPNAQNILINTYYLEYKIVNRSSGTITVYNFQGVSLFTIPSSSDLTLLCTNNSTTGGIWVRINAPSSSSITGQLYGSMIYGLSNPYTNFNTNTTIPFNQTLSTFGNTDFISSNSGGMISLNTGYMYELYGFCSHFSSPSNGGIGFRWRLNGSEAGTYGASAVATAQDQNIGASSPAIHLFNRPAGSGQASVDLVLTGWSALNFYNGNANIASSFIRLTAYRL